MTGVMLDFDNKHEDTPISTNDFIRKFKDYHFIIYPSSNHLKKIDSNKVPIEKFRVILPLDPDKYSHYNTPEMHKRAYNDVMEQFPEMDKTPTGAHSKFYPSSLNVKDFFVNLRSLAIL